MARSSAKVEQIATPSSEDVAAQLATLRADLAGLTNIIGELGKGKASELSNAAAQKAEEARAKGQEQLQLAKVRASELQDQANDFVTKQPATALAVAAGAGFLIGFLSNRR